jgi:hypothetical protein
MSTRLAAFPPSPRTAQLVAHRLRCDGFYSLPDRLWSNAADLAELLADAGPTGRQLMWLHRAYEFFLTHGASG